jgi:two-component system nitrate/nitrite response regulator NarL
LQRLTRREREVLDLVADGLSNKQIARRLRIELPTVKNHVHSILDKLDVSRRAQAVAYLHRSAGV